MDARISDPKRSSFKFQLTQVAQAQSRFRIIPPSTPEFSLQRNGRVESTAAIVSPGITRTIRVTFTPRSNKICTDAVIIECPDSTGAIIRRRLPLDAIRDPPRLEGLDTFTDLGSVLPHAPLHRTVTITNTGSDGLLTLMSDPTDPPAALDGTKSWSEGPFTVTPGQFAIASGETRDLEVMVDTTTCGTFEASFWAGDCGARPVKYTLRVAVHPVDTSVIQLDGHTLAVPVTCVVTGPGPDQITRDDASDEAAILVADLRETVIGGCRDVRVTIRNSTPLPVPLHSAFTRYTRSIEALHPAHLPPNGAADIIIRFQPEKTVTYEADLQVTVGPDTCPATLTTIRVAATSTRPDVTVNPNLLLLPGDFLVRKSVTDWVSVSNNSRAPLYCVWSPDSLHIGPDETVDLTQPIHLGVINVDIAPREVVIAAGQTMQFRVSLKGVAAGRAKADLIMHALPTETDDMSSRMSRPGDPLSKFRRAVMGGRGTRHALALECGVAGPEVHVEDGGLEFGPIMVHQGACPTATLTLTNNSDTYAPFVLTDLCEMLPAASRTGGRDTRLAIRPEGDRPTPDYIDDDPDAIAPSEPSSMGDDHDGLGGQGIFRFYDWRGCLGPLETQTVTIELDLAALLRMMDVPNLTYPHSITGFIGVHVQHQAMPMLVQCRGTLCRPALGLDPVSISFPEAFIHQPSTAQVTLHNLSLAETQFAFPTASTGLFGLTFTPHAGSIPAGGSTEVTLTLTPRRVSSFSLHVECRVDGVAEPYGLAVSCNARGCSLMIGVDEVDDQTETEGGGGLWSPPRQPRTAPPRSQS